MLSWLSFLAAVVFRSFTLGKFDVVVTLTSPPFLSVCGILLKWLRGSRFFLWEMDVYPDVAFAADAVSTGTLLARTVAKGFAALRRRADGIITLGQCMRDRLVGQGMDASKVFIAENWVVSPMDPLPFPKNGPLVVAYSGNLGVVHDVETIAEALPQLGDGFRFIFAGGGVRRGELESICRARGVNNVEFRPYTDQGGLNDLLGSCHIGLVTLRARCKGTVVPSKTYSVMAAGRPFLYIGPRESTPDRIARMGCGWQVDPGDVESLVSTLRTLRRDLPALERAGRFARRLAASQHTVEDGAGRITDIVLGTVGQLKPAVAVEKEVAFAR